MKYFIGIDPGLTGAVAWMNDMQNWEVSDIPVIASGKGKSLIKKEVDSYELNLLFSAYANMAKYGGVVAIVEQVNARPGQGVSSVFSLGQTFGAIKACLAAQKIPVEFITP